MGKAEIPDAGEEVFCYLVFRAISPLQQFWMVCTRLFKESSQVRHSNLRRRPAEIRAQPLGPDIGNKPIIQCEGNVRREGSLLL